jgi:hypothetical protein
MNRKEELLCIWNIVVVHKFLDCGPVEKWKKERDEASLPSCSFDPYIFDGESTEQQQQHDGDADGIRAGGIYLYTIWVGWGGWGSKGLAI